jgi:hypothetical protein
LIDPNPGVGEQKSEAGRKSPLCRAERQLRDTRILRTPLPAEDLALAEAAWLTDQLLTHRHLIPNGLVVLLRAFQRALQEPDDSVLGIVARTGRRASSSARPFTLGGGTAPRSAQRLDRVSRCRRVPWPR